MSSSEDEEEDYDYYGSPYDYNFWHDALYYDVHWRGDDEYVKRERKEQTERRRADLKKGIDYRDHKCEDDDETKCMFCGVNAAITKRSAKQNGINWEEYKQGGYETCWVCKDKHISVLTEAMACKKFARVLDTTETSLYAGEYRPVFSSLKCDGKSFHHQPVTSCEEWTRNSQFFWYPDLEKEALARGWKPRGKKKEEVPWTRKDIPTTQDEVMDSKSHAKKRKAEEEKHTVKHPHVLTSSTDHPNENVPSNTK